MPCSSKAMQFSIGNVHAHLSADATSSLVAAGCGYASWADLVLANVDYIVDGLTLQLKQPGKHPAAPQLLAALFQHSQLSPALLPALTEPATCALQGLSILSRRQRPDHARALLLAVRPVLQAAGAEGAQLQQESGDMAATVHAALTAQHDGLFAQLQALDLYDKSAERSQHSGSVQLHEDAAMPPNQLRNQADAHLRSGANAAVPEGDSAADFFEQYHGGQEGLREGGAAERRERASKFAMPAHDRDILQRRMGRVAAASELAATACETAGPLLLAEDLATCVAAHATVEARFMALCAALHAGVLLTRHSFAIRFRHRR